MTTQYINTSEVSQIHLADKNPEG